MQLRTLKQLDETEGTVTLHEAVEHITTQHLKNTDLVLFPHPSDDPNDPLRWPTWRKNAAFFSVCGLAFVANISGGVYPAFPLIAQDFDKSYTTVGGLISWPILAFGLGNFIWVPLAVYFGKRPIFIFSCIIAVAAQIGTAAAQSFSGLFAASVINGFAGAATEALGAAIVNDIFFLHQRATKMSIYIIILASTNSVGPLICGFMAQTTSWRWFKGLAAILAGLDLIALIFLFPETRFERHLEDIRRTPIQDEKPMASPNVDKTSTTEQVDRLHETETGSDRNILPKKTNLQLLSLWSGTPEGVNLFELTVRPFPFIIYPAVAWATLAYSVALASVAMISSFNPAILQSPPYNMTVSINGLINIAGLIGNVVGAVVGGWLTDKVADFWAIRHNGIFTPEIRLVMVTAPLITVPIGLALFGVAAEQLMPWPVIFVSYGLASVGLTAIPSISMTYVLDAYYPVAAESLLLVNGLKNTIAFGFLYGIYPWVAEVGYKSAFGTMAGIFVIIVGAAYPLAYFGQRIRHYTSNKWRVIIW